MSPRITQDTSQYTDNKEHDSLLLAKRTTDVGSDLQTLVDIVDDTTIYTALGARGVATSSTGWLLEKISVSGGVYTIKHGVDSWDNRTTATYT